MKNDKNLYQWCFDNNNDALLKEYNSKRNDISIKDISYGSNRKVWWKCSKGHEWENTVYIRTKRNSSCPICNGRKLQAGVNDLSTTHKQLLLDWDYKKNKTIKPEDVTRISHKRVFWICHKCGHKWDIEIFRRAIHGDGCPKCALKKRGEAKHKTALKTNGYLNDSELLKDWDVEANLPKTPKDYTPQSNMYAFWKCHKCGYKWKAKVNNRVKGRGCPACSNKTAVKGINDLATTHPNIAKEWHPTKNGKITPYDITYGYGKKVFWLCSKGHEYIATVNHRTGINGTKCPICNIGRQTSFAEQALYFYIKKEFPDALNKYKPVFLKPMELDIYIPSIKTAIEYDGAAWHKKENLEREQRKYKLCRDNGIRLWRVREEMPELGSDIADMMFNCGGRRLFERKYLNELIIEVIEHLTLKMRMELDINVFRDEQLILGYVKELEGKTFASEYPEIAKEWHPTKNEDTKPNMFKPHSDHYAWWICPTCGNEYYASISHRSYGTGCPNCGAKKSHDSRRLAIEMIDPKTNKVLKEFKSISDASKELKINSSNISMVCKGKTNRTMAGGYKWRYKK